MATTRTARDLIDHALFAIGAYNPADTVAAADITTCLEVLQDLLAEWSSDGLAVPAQVTEYFALVVGTTSYTVGENGSPTLNTERPEQVISAWIRDSSSFDSPVAVIDKKAYDRIAIKSMSGGTVTDLYVDYSAPNATFYVWPAPSSTDSLYFSSIKPLSEPALTTENLLNTTLLPRNYFNALKFNLAVDLCPVFTREVPPVIAKRAVETLAAIKSLNFARNMGPVSLDVLSGDGVSAYQAFEMGI